MTPFTFWKTVETLRLIKGNCYVQRIINPANGQDLSWHIRENQDVQVYEDNDTLWYKYKGKLYPASDWLHFKAFSEDGKVGVGVVTYAAKSLGVSLENQDFGQNVFKNRGLTYGTIETDKSVDPKNAKIIEQKFSEKLSSKEVHNVALLDEGFKYNKISITPAEAQFLETNKNGIVEVCRWLNIAPHLLKDLTNANYSNIYQQSIEHVQLSVLPRVISKEQEINYKCLSSSEQMSTYVKFNINSLLRGDLDAKAKFYTSMAYAGIYTRNEVRELEDLNPVEGMDEPLQPVNMQALSIANQLINEQDNGSNNQ
jgi:HK97 family phage portal protein